ncbi:MAG: hypothetical protein SH850_23085 [Planctomycetaceae bacterium]|nr:hypothetical protein [Planctomycetaceae bacterium]
MSTNRSAVAAVYCVIPLAIMTWLLPPAAAADPETAPAQVSQRQPIGEDFIDIEAAKIDYQAVFAAGMSGGSIAPTPRLKQIMADSSVTKISTHLLQMPPADASARAQRLFDRLLRAHQSGLEQCMSRVKGEDLSKGIIPVSDNAHALSSSLFLCALYCDRETFLKKLDAWHSVIGPLVAECESNPKLILFRDQASMDGLPQHVLVLNLYVIILERDAQLDVAAIERRCGRRLPHFRAGNLPYWNGDENRAEFTPIPRGLLGDHRKVVTWVNVAQDWGGMAAYSDARPDPVLAAVRKLVDNIGKPGF